MSINVNEKRRLRRTSGHSFGVIALQIDAKATIHTAIVRDYSVEGMGIVIDLPASPVTNITIHLKRRNKTVKIDGEVRHTTLLDGGQWLVGFQLSRLLGVDDF